jgi:hypothetical protein
MPKQPYSNFDLPRQHLGVEGHYVPPKARDEAEIARRKTLPPGTLIAEQQAKSLRVAHTILHQLAPGEGMGFASHMIGMATINSSWYTYGQGAPDVMRRRLLLPIVADKETDWRKSAEELQIDALGGLDQAHRLASGIADAIAANTLTKRRVRQFGQYLGNVSLRVAVAGDGRTTLAGDAFEVQEQVRAKALDLLEFAREFGDQTGAHPSVAQLDDPDSPLNVYWRRKAPNDAFQAHQNAIGTNS